MNELAPIVLFVYNRPWHTDQTLNALMQNELADESVLYIFADGPKENATDEQLKKISEVRQLIRSKQWCKEAHIIEAEKNKGLADSIIDGVTQIVNEYGKIIVLEDDIITSKGFLRYMNDALAVYENEENVFHISGYMFPVKGKLPETFFYRQTSCWGWGTWPGKWNQLEKSPVKLKQQLINASQINYADIDGTNQFINQLNDNIDGRIKTWAVLWHFSVFLKNGLSLHPRKSLVKNIGNDSSGVNSGSTTLFEVEPIERIQVKKIKIEDYKKVYNFLKIFYDADDNHNLFNATKNRIYSFVPSKFKHGIKILTNKKFKENEQERLRIQNLPRFTQTEINFLNKKIKIVDNASFQFLKKEIFGQQIYQFKTGIKEPYIIDCGANIGLSVIYFKQLYPKAKVIGFEPDDTIFKVLQHNIGVFNLPNVELIKKACWNKETSLQFYSEGADGGRAAKDFDTENLIEVETTRLRKYLNRQVDFLKIDIEGAENEVLQDIKDLLVNVERLFVEFHSFIGREQMLPEILSIIKDAGFRFTIHHVGVYSPNPFISVSSYNSMDLQLNIYGYRS
jgi:FkbM family methyltransferase